MTTFAQGERSRNYSTERGGGEEALSEGEQPTTLQQKGAQGAPEEASKLT